MSSTQETAETCERLLAMKDKWADPANRMTPRDWAALRLQGIKVEIAVQAPLSTSYDRAKREGRKPRGGNWSPSARAERAARAYLAQDPAVRPHLSMSHFARVEGCNVGFVSLKVTRLRQAAEAQGLRPFRIYQGDHKPVGSQEAA